ncbi:hypothetical protein SU69_02115 [Thermosipho melanesiensis]|uniref:Uncharacterized protein n=1 Tax=Thermosipho melanesiensis TaxID=46541 RepID=A0ABM6GGK7_9BACT|nr:hypothetical protein [Thermosipho melanesiensis]APT74816.1 hypothetical protein BW47_02205 [Thermosipho melanesiensis]OOC37400.1 hypothetical protein SU68_02125 [Thermosipho melanesiensis]OOC39762.1 hypothetical protein SU69_02115 [Thermosipho melanesiensis]OOC39867.1 hypothetical protein SU70_02110 [Thermosipho melanesiensis]OOC43795.1 hypothetical protein SU71_02100 [Thermosipho melanesiensis]
MHKNNRDKHKEKNNRTGNRKAEERVLYFRKDKENRNSKENDMGKDDILQLTIIVFYLFWDFMLKIFSNSLK